MKRPKKARPPRYPPFILHVEPRGEDHYLVFFTAENEQGWTKLMLSKEEIIGILRFFR